MGIAIVCMVKAANTSQAATAGENAEDECLVTNSNVTATAAEVG